MNTEQTKLFMKLHGYAIRRKGELHDLIEDAAEMIHHLSDENERLKAQLNWVTDRYPTPAEAEYAGDSGFILCVSGRDGNRAYIHAIMMGDNYYEEGKWRISGVGKPDSITVHSWMLPPAWEDADADSD